MNIKATLTVINELRAAGIVERYAIGGAVGAAFYLEPAETKDVDIFVALSAPDNQMILTLEPIYEYLRAKGYNDFRDEGVIIEGWPVQFLDGGPLVQEAILSAAQKDIGGVQVDVFRAEHLAAIALQVGRPKDRNRLIQFWESGVLDIERFWQVLERHELTDAWIRFRKRFFE